MSDDINVDIQPLVQIVDIATGPPGPAGPQGPKGDGGDGSTWLLDLQAGNTVAARQHNDSERNAAIAACGLGQIAQIVSPPGEFYFDTELEIDRPVTLRGAGDWFSRGSNWWTPVGRSCLRIDYAGGPVPASGRGTLIERMRFGPAGSTSFDGSTPGADIRARCTLRNVNVTSANGHGVAVVASTNDNPPTNANLVRLDTVRADGAKGDGFFFDGADANACLLTACDASSNAAHGFHDSSFLGVFLAGCHSEANGGRGYLLGEDPNADSMAFFCYTEGGQGALNLLLNKALWVGPYPPGGFDPTSNAPLVTPTKINSLYFENLGVAFRAGRIANAVAFELSAVADGSKPWQWGYANGLWQIIYNGTDAIDEWHDDSFAVSEEQRQRYFPKGFSAPQRLYARTSDRNMTTWDTGKCSTNFGATGDVNMNLPITSQVPDGWWHDFEVDNAGGFFLIVNANVGAGDIVRLKSDVGFGLQSNLRGDCWRVRKARNGAWTVCRALADGLQVFA